jgi:DNA-binding Xre family transcriptional regulator
MVYYEHNQQMPWYLEGGENLDKLTLRQMRRIREISQIEMARRLGVAPGTYVVWERCPAKIKTGRLIEICRILNCSVDDIILFNKADEPFHDEEAQMDFE